jgi:hypothetical protein
VGQNDGGGAGALEGADDVEQVGVIALLGRGDAEGLEALAGVVEGIEAGTPAFVAEGEIGDDVVEALETGPVAKLGIGEGVALHDEGGGVVVQDHVHARQDGGGGVLFLTVEGDRGARLVGDLEQQGGGAAGRVVDGGVGAGDGLADTRDLGDDPAGFGGGQELALALAAVHGEVAHEIFVGIANDVVAFGTVTREIQRLVLEDGDEVGEPLDHLFAAAELGRVVKVRHVGQSVGLRQGGEDLLVDLVADVGPALEGNHVPEAGARGDDDGGVGVAGVFVADVFDEEQDQDIVLVLAGVHAAAQFVATGPEGGVKLRDCLVNNLLIYNEKNLKIHDHLPPCNFIWKFKYGFSR